MFVPGGIIGLFLYLQFQGIITVNPKTGRCLNLSVICSVFFIR